MKIINLLKNPAGNTEQKILKVFLIVVLPVMAILTTVAIIHISYIPIHDWTANL